ncbi:hypothetical protein KKB55_18245 [Myxococcota bacterium]|nr:hypothetical protein [Myxococcota bacterium]MBU1899686.1 hypothetical protein [Myxococcota bacterium]
MKLSQFWQNLSAFALAFPIFQDGSALRAQEGAPKDEIPIEDFAAQTRVVGSWLATVGIDGLEIQVYEMPGNPDNVVYIAPYHFALDNNGKVDIREVKTTFDKNGSGKIRLVLTLVRNPQGTRSKIAEQLRFHGIKPNITEANVNPADILSVQVQDITPNLKDEIRFKPVEERFPSGRTLEIDALVSEDLKGQFIKWIQDEGGLRFRIIQRVFGESIEWESTLTLQTQFLQAIHNEMEVQGPVIAGNIKEAKPPYVTRKQLDEIIDRARNHVRGEMRIMGDPNMSHPIIRQLDALTQEAFKGETIFFEDEDVWGRMDTQNLTKNGLQPSKINNFLDDMKKKSDVQRSESMKTGGSANANVFGVFKAGASGNYESSSSYHQVDENSMVWQRKGDIEVPVGFELYRLSNAFVDKARDIGVRGLKTRKAIAESQMVITTQSPPTWVVRSVQVDRYAHENFVKVLNFVLGKATQTDPSKTPELLTPPIAIESKMEFGDKNKPLILRRGQRFELVKLTSPGDEPKDKPYGYTLTVILNNEAGDNIVHQLAVKGKISGEILPLNAEPGPIKYLAMGDVIYIMIRGPEAFTKPSGKGEVDTKK